MIDLSLNLQTIFTIIGAGCVVVSHSFWNYYKLKQALIDISELKERQTDDRRERDLRFKELDVRLTEVLLGIGSIQTELKLSRTNSRQKGEN